jgi:hypothetical protein
MHTAPGRALLFDVFHAEQVRGAKKFAPKNPRKTCMIRKSVQRFSEKIMHKR